MTVPVTIEDIRAAGRRIADAVVRTPTLHSRTLSELTGGSVYLKFENLQFTAAYKERGALNRLLLMPAEQRARGVIAASAGNHAQALAYHGRRLGVPVTIVMPAPTPAVKVIQTEGHGARVVLHGERFDDAFLRPARCRWRPCHELAHVLAGCMRKRRLRLEGAAFDAVVRAGTLSVARLLELAAAGRVDGLETCDDEVGGVVLERRPPEDDAEVVPQGRAGGSDGEERARGGEEGGSGGRGEHGGEWPGEAPTVVAPPPPPRAAFSFAVAAAITGRQIQVFASDTQKAQVGCGQWALGGWGGGGIVGT